MKKDSIDLSELYEEYLKDEFGINKAVKNENGTYFSLALQQGFEIFVKGICYYIDKKASG